MSEQLDELAVCYCGHIMATQHTLREDGMYCDKCNAYHSPKLWNDQWKREKERIHGRAD